MKIREKGAVLMMQNLDNDFLSYKTALKRTVPNSFYSEENGCLFLGDSLQVLKKFRGSSVVRSVYCSVPFHDLPPPAVPQPVPRAPCAPRRPAAARWGLPGRGMRAPGPISAIRCRKHTNRPPNRVNVSNRKSGAYGKIRR